MRIAESRFTVLGFVGRVVAVGACNDTAEATDDAAFGTVRVKTQSDTSMGIHGD